MVAPLVAGVRAAAAANAERTALQRASQAAASRMRAADAGGKKYRITMVTAVAMLALSTSFDAAQFFATFLNIIPGLGVVVGLYLGIVAETIFTIWFLLCGAWQGPGGKGAATRLLIMVGTVATELTPLIQALPAITLGVTAMIFVARAEDELGTRDLKTASLTDLSRVARRDVVPMARYGAARYQEEQAVTAEDYGISEEERASKTNPETGRTEFQELQRQQLVEDAMRRDVSGYRAAREADLRSRRSAPSANDATDAEAA